MMKRLQSVVSRLLLAMLEALQAIKILAILPKLDAWVHLIQELHSFGALKMDKVNVLKNLF